MLGTASSVLCAELVKEFLEFYKLDYTLSIYMPETNLNAQQVMSKDELQSKVGVANTAEHKPVLMHLLESFMAAEGPVKGGIDLSSPDKVAAPKEIIAVVIPPAMMPAESNPVLEESKTEDHLEKA